MGENVVSFVCDQTPPQFDCFSEISALNAVRLEDESRGITE